MVTVVSVAVVLVVMVLVVRRGSTSSSWLASPVTSGSVQENQENMQVVILRDNPSEDRRSKC